MAILLRFGLPGGGWSGWDVSEAMEGFVTSLESGLWLGLWHRQVWRCDSGRLSARMLGRNFEISRSQRDRRFHRLLLAKIAALAAMPSTPKDQAAACCLADHTLRKAGAAGRRELRRRWGGNSDALELWKLVRDISV